MSLALVAANLSIPAIRWPFPTSANPQETQAPVLQSWLFDCRRLPDRYVTVDDGPANVTFLRPALSLPFRLACGGPKATGNER